MSEMKKVELFLRFLVAYATGSGMEANDTRQIA